jgi:serine protease AprX
MTKKTAVLVSFLVFSFVFLLYATTVFAPGNKIRPPLQNALDSAGQLDLVPVSIILNDQLEGERLRSLVPVASKGQARRQAVVSALKEHAAATQSGILLILKEAQKLGEASRIRPLWIGNVIGADLTPKYIHLIAELPEVARINHNPKVDVFLEGGDLDLNQSMLPSESDSTPGTLSGSTTEIECGVDLMRAPEVWNELGFTGDGAVIALIDTGVCWYHPDIINQIWVNPGEDLDMDGVVMDDDDMNGVDDDSNGYVDDLIGWDVDNNDNDPNDNNSHGSHCAGTIAGDGTSGTQAGMAPDAKIMVLRVGVQFSDEVDVWNAMQYAADNGADSISMSLGWPHGQNPDRPTWRTNCENTIDAGTAMVIAAGNEGSGNEPDNVRTPGDVPRIISVGATDCSDQIAGFSSRGPVTWEDVPPWNDYPYPPGLIKPDVSAPGVSTKSHNLCSGYSFKSGTSMATPHTAGAVALMKSVNPGLTHDDIKFILEDTSVDLGAAGKDNTYGSGRVDAYEAVLLSGTSDGIVILNRNLYSCADTMSITLADKDLQGTGTQTVEMTSTTEQDPELATLTETSETSGVFRGTFPTGSGTATPDGILQVANGDTIEVLYVDADDGEGGVNVEKRDYASADCIGPFISDIRETDIDNNSAVIRWNTDEVSTSDVTYGTTRPPTQTKSSSGLVNDHAVILTGLPECTIIYYEISSTDSVGNASTDDNAGSYYYFETYGNFPEVGIVPCHAGQVSLDTEVYSCLDSVTVTVTDIDLNQDTDLVETVEVTLTSSTETDEEALLLTETGPNTSQFRATMNTIPGPAWPDGWLQTSDGDTITATYRDEDDGAGAYRVASASAVADCAGPVISSLHIEEITNSRVEVVWTTEEPATSRVEFGPTPGLGSFEADNNFITSHRLAISPFDPCGQYYFRVISGDTHGNQRLVMGPDGPFAFNSWEIPGLFFYDGFETDKGWSMNGEWERGSPFGLGGSSGHADPSRAWSGLSVLGTDLTGQGSYPGDYEPDTSTGASTPILDATELSNGKLIIRRKLGVHTGPNDQGSIKIRKGFWFGVWQNHSQTVNDSDYTYQSYDISGNADGNPALEISFSISSNESINYAGWTIDEFIIKDGSLPDFDACAECTGAPTFSGLQTAQDIDACAPGGVRLNWEMAKAWGTGSGGTYAVYRSTTSGFEPGPANLIASGVAGTSFDDAAAPESVNLYYRVRAESDETCSTGPNNNGVVDGNLLERMARNDISQPPPGFIATLSVFAVNDAHVRLEWDAVPDGVTYRIYRSEQPDMSGAFMLEETTDTFYEDTHEILNNKSYYYRVQAANACGQE